jgi:hypothetical protein
MRRITIRLIVAAIVFGGAWVVYQLSDFTDCSGPRAEAWADATVRRGEEAFGDHDTITAYTSLAEYAHLSNRAESRYRDQLAQSGPSCLDDLHDAFVEFFFTQWKMYQAASHGNFDLAVEYEDDTIRAFNRAHREYDRLAEQYNWDTD